MVVCLLSAVTGLMAQMRAPTSPSDSVVFRGFSAHLDIASPWMGIAVDKGVITGEIQFDVNLRNKFFPIVEVGYAAIEHVADNGATYRAGAPFWRLGLNYNVLKTTREDGSEKLHRHYPFTLVLYLRQRNSTFLAQHPTQCGHAFLQTVVWQNYRPF